MDSAGWIDAAKRKPTRKDADVTGCVLAWHRYNGAMITGWRNVRGNALYTHWQPTPAVPKGYDQEYRELWEVKK